MTDVGTPSPLWPLPFSRRELTSIRTDPHIYLYFFVLIESRFLDTVLALKLTRLASNPEILLPVGIKVFVTTPSSMLLTVDVI